MYKQIKTIQYIIECEDEFDEEVNSYLCLGAGWSILKIGFTREHICATLIRKVYFDKED